ncbi:head GIN domain-containing protein [Flavobacterium sp.]|uniref:head GIN domain-containing protein n=1 Tax=Flavobacterium sp. TaxID=239 RepID=UPI0025EAA3E3|nr:head GIN domain-containing protein [Flavobacterium sp.]
MVKFIVFCTKIIAATIAAVLFSSCHTNISWGEGLDGNGKVITEKRNVEGNFSKVDVSRGLNVTLEQADTYFVEVEADQNLQEHITTKVENGTLFITSDENIDEATAKNIRVKLPSLMTLTTTSGASVTTKNTFSGTDIEVKASSGSEADLNLEFDNVKCETSSGGSLTVKGKALKLTTHSSSGSEIDARGLLVNEVVSESSSGSSTDVNPIVSLNAKASSGGSIDYSSSPKTVVKEESSGGSVSKE